jgi:hypothetical protein
VSAGENAGTDIAEKGEEKRGPPGNHATKNAPRRMENQTEIGSVRKLTRASEPVPIGYSTKVEQCA